MKFLKKQVYAVFILLSFSAIGQQSVRIACIGNSITEGYGIKEPAVNAYPGQLQALLGNHYQVLNFGVSGTTLLREGNHPYWNTARYKAALESRPDIVFIKLGTNDSKLVNRAYYRHFRRDLHDLVQSFRTLSTHPRVILLLPVTAFTTDSSSIYEPVIKDSIIPLIRQVAYDDNLEIIDLHSLFAEQAALVPDKIHPNKEGAAIIAGRLYQLLKQQRDTGYAVASRIAGINNNSTSFYGYTCFNFSFEGRSCHIVRPKWAAPNHPWVWRARFWGHEPQADIALLERGFHIVYCDVAEMFGNKEAITIWNHFYKMLTRAGFAKKAVLEAMSRGGVYAYNWAAANPEKVACVYADNPVLDLKSWPGGKGKGPGSADDWEKVKVDFQLQSEASVAAFAGSPVNKVKLIVKGRYPMLHVCGDADEVVPMEENTIPFEQQVKALGGDITVLHKPGFKHHPHSLPDPTPIVNFILKAVPLP